MKGRQMELSRSRGCERYMESDAPVDVHADKRLLLQQPNSNLEDAWDNSLGLGRPLLKRNVRKEMSSGVLSITEIIIARMNRIPWYRRG